VRLRPGSPAAALAPDGPDWEEDLGAPLGFGVLARLLGLVPQLPAPWPPEEQEKEDACAKLVLDHFFEHRPSPTSFPSQALRIFNLLADPNVEMAELSRMIELDPGLSTSVLRVANSALNKGTSGSQTVEEAICRLGIVEVAHVATLVSARTLFNPVVRTEHAALGARWKALFEHSATTALGAAFAIMRAPGRRSDFAFLAGMLHDIGKSIALRSVAALIREKRLAIDASDAVIDRVLERVHVTVGREVHDAWQLPPYSMAICAQHHHGSPPVGPEWLDLHAVRLVSAVHLLRTEPRGHLSAPLELQQSAQALALDGFALRALGTEIRRIGDGVHELHTG
jgi:HD-like signal output (HDOD) protein